MANSILIAISLRHYLQHGFSGLMMPCAYLRDKGAKGMELGIAFFLGPHPEGREALEFPPDPAFDDRFGNGATVMLISAVRALQAASEESRITLMQPIGLDIRPRSLLETLGFGFLMLGREIICLKTHITEDDPAWTVLRSEGFESVVHLAAVPLRSVPTKHTSPCRHSHSPRSFPPSQNDMNLKILSLSEARATRAKFTHVITLLETEHLGDIPHLGIPPEKRLLLVCDDVNSPEVGEFSAIRPPTKQQVRRGLEFARTLPADAKLLVHCYAGVSRSAAMAYAILCQARPRTSEAEILRRLSSTRRLFIPNSLILTYADELLERYGRMMEAVEEYRLNYRR